MAAEVPCMDVGSTTGDFLYYVQRRTRAGEIVGTSGTRTAPNKVTIKNEPVSGEPPHLPGRRPPRVAAKRAIAHRGRPGAENRCREDEAGARPARRIATCGSEYWCKAVCVRERRARREDNEPQASGKYCDSSTDMQHRRTVQLEPRVRDCAGEGEEVLAQLNIGQDFSFIGTQADVCGTTETLAAKQYTCIDKEDYSYNGEAVRQRTGDGQRHQRRPRPGDDAFLDRRRAARRRQRHAGARLGYARGTASGAIAFDVPRRRARRLLVRPRALLANAGATFLVVAGGLAEVDDKFSVPIIEVEPRQGCLSDANAHRLAAERQARSQGRFGLMVPTGGAGQGVTAEVKLVALFPIPVSPCHARLVMR
jgi:hypothetical protein